MQYWDLYRLIRKHRVFIATLVLIAVVLAVVVMYIYPVYPKVQYESSARLVVTPPGFEVTQLSTEQRPWYFAVNQDEVFTTTVAELVTSEAVLDMAAADIDDAQQEKAIRATTDAEAIKAPTLGIEMFTRIIEVKSRSGSPEDAKANTDTVVDAFLDFYAEASREQAAREKALIEEELVDAKARYGEAQALTTSFKEENAIADIDYQVTILADRYHALNHELQASETEFDELRSSQEKALKKLVALTRSEIEELPALQAELAGLLIAEQAAEEAYVVLETKLAEATIAQSINAAAGQVDVVDYGNEPELPVSYVRLVKSAEWLPAFDYRKAIVLVAVLLLSGLLALGLVIGARRVDNRVRDGSDAERISGLPTLGTIPVTDRPTPAVADAVSSAYVEAYRSLQARVTRHVAASKGTQVLAVTSATTAEGRTSLAYNLGYTLAEAGMRVALVDGDLRGRDLTKLVNDIDVDRGIVAAANGDGSLDPDSLVEAAPSMWLLGAEDHASPSASLFNSEGFARMLEQLRADYDVVIVDTPPALAFADAMFIASHCDGAVFVMKAGTPQRGAFVTALEQLREAGAELIGTVVMGVEDEDYEGSYHHARYMQERRGQRDETRTPDDAE